jgi:TPP-dependent indolepyruvate ferredoxin oxidoreductase alpha subunit
LRGRNLIPANARPAHRRLRQKLSEMAEWSETTPLNHVIPGDRQLGIITSGVCFMHAREAAPDASFLKLGFTHPLPLKKSRSSSAASNAASSSRKAIRISPMPSAPPGWRWKANRKCSASAN